MSSPAVGEEAPPFALPGTPGGRMYSLGDYRGQPVVVVFYPADNTPVCITQLRTYDADIDRFSSLGAQVLAISPQGLESHEEFAQEHGLSFPLLADVDKQVGRSYGIVGPLGYYKRSVFVVDGQGVVRYAHRSGHGLTYRPTEELIAAIEAAGASAR